MFNAGFASNPIAMQLFRQDYRINMIKEGCGITDASHRRN